MLPLTLPLSECILPHSPSPLHSALKSRSSTLQLLITFNIPLYLSAFIFHLSLLLHSASLFLSSPRSRASLSHCLSLSLSLSELSVQTVEYMLSKYTSPLSLRLNKLQQGERKRKAVGQEEGRMGAQRGDEARKKGNIQVKQHLHVQRLQNQRGTAIIQSGACGGKHYH